MPIVIPEGVESQPWGDKPPPLPATASRKDANQIVTAWKFWKGVRPTYVKDADEIICSIDLKDRVWHGRAPISDPADHSIAAWHALHNCIGAWLDDTNLLRGLAKRLRRNR
jgi:hypothetical protein